MAILKVLIIILILLFPIGELGRINIYNEVATTVNDILVALVVFVWLAWLTLKNKFTEITSKNLSKPILIFVFIAFLSLIVNYRSLNFSEFIISFLYLVRFVCYALIYFIVSEFDLKFKKKILVLLVISGSLITFGGFVQYFLYPNLRNLYYLGWDEHLYRLFSSFLDPNFAASVISLFLTLLLSLVIFGFSKNQKIRFFLIFLSTFSFIALLLTYSRSGYLMFLTSASVLLLMLGKIRYIAILLIVFTVGIILLPKNLGGEGVKLLRTASIISRSGYLDNAITIFRENPILGVGFNAYRYAQYRYGFIDEFSLSTSHAAAGTDNSFLFVLATTGIVGLTSYLYIWIKILKGCHPKLVSGSDEMLKRVQHDIKRETFQKIVSIVIMASSVGLFVNAFFINSLFYPFIMLWMWILIALTKNK